MKSFAPELAALTRAADPRLNAAELETRAFLAEMDAVCEQINNTPREVRMERSAAVLAMIVSAADAEAVRAAYWMRAPLAARMVAVMSARMPKERAHDALNKFDALERGLVWIELQKLVGHLTVVQKCMAGGRMPTTTGTAH